MATVTGVGAGRVSTTMTDPKIAEETLRAGVFSAKAEAVVKGLIADSKGTRNFGRQFVLLADAGKGAHSIEEAQKIGLKLCGDKDARAVNLDNKGEYSCVPKSHHEIGLKDANKTEAQKKENPRRLVCKHCHVNEEPKDTKLGTDATLITPDKIPNNNPKEHSHGYCGACHKKPETFALAKKDGKEEPPLCDKDPEGFDQNPDRTGGDCVGIIAEVKKTNWKHYIKGKSEDQVENTEGCFSEQAMSGCMSCHTNGEPVEEKK